MSLAGLSLRDLEYAIAVADCGHFGRAAARCHVSQPALSAQIRRLEALLDLRIFERTRKGVLVTAQGEPVIAHARQITAEARKLLSFARSSEETLSGPLRLGAIPTVGPYMLPHCLRPFRKAFPHMRLVLSEGRTADLVERLLAGQLDAMIACGPIDTPGLASEALFFEPFMIAHPPQVRPSWPPATFSGEFVLLEEGHCLRDQTLALCGPQPPGDIRHATGLELLRHMVAAGEGVSLMPALAARALGPIDGLLTYTQAPADAGRLVVLVGRVSDPRTGLFSRLAELARRSVPAPAVPALQPIHKLNDFAA